MFWVFLLRIFRISLLMPPDCRWTVLADLSSFLSFLPRKYISFLFCFPSRSTLGRLFKMVHSQFHSPQILCSSLPGRGLLPRCLSCLIQAKLFVPLCRCDSGSCSRVPQAPGNLCQALQNILLKILPSGFIFYFFPSWEIVRRTHNNLSTL